MLQTIFANNLERKRTGCWVLDKVVGEGGITSYFQQSKGSCRSVYNKETGQGYYWVLGWKQRLSILLWTRPILDLTRFWCSGLGSVWFQAKNMSGVSGGGAA